MFDAGQYDVIVVGAGHAGCEAALASARLGCKTLMATISLDSIGFMPCNPSIGGPAKGHLVREIDALGGQMAIQADQASIQMRLLNTGKGLDRGAFIDFDRDEVFLFELQEGLFYGVSAYAD